MAKTQAQIDWYNNWHTDHCHTTGKVRGILCGWCNTALGKFQEDPNILKSAIGSRWFSRGIQYTPFLLELQRRVLNR